MTIRLEIVTAEHPVFADDVDVVVVPGIEGEMAILPKHAPLMTMIEPGELMIRKSGQETYLVVTGGFIEVRQSKIVILADAAERAEEIDIERAEEAKRRAEMRLKLPGAEVDHARAEAALRRSLTRLKVASRRRKNR